MDSKHEKRLQTAQLGTTQAKKVDKQFTINAVKAGKTLKKQK